MINRAQSSRNGISNTPMSTPDQDHGNRGENHPDTAPIPNFDYLAIPGPMTHLPSSRLFNASLDRLDQGTLLLSLENVLADIVAVDGESASPGSQLSSARDGIGTEPVTSDHNC